MYSRKINDVRRGLTQVLMETDNAGTIQASYIYGYDLISMKRTGVNYCYYHYDGLGSVRLMTDDLCLVTNSYTYDGFGNSVSSVSSVANSYGFTGEQQFAEADQLVFLRARYYSPQIGRFISRDPIGYRGGLNIYSYVRNNPNTFIDPMGLKPWYGKYCGPGSGSGAPADILDEQCKKHDDCYAKCGFGGVIGFCSPDPCHTACDIELCIGAMFSDCFTSPTPWKCHAARLIITELFCGKSVIVVVGL